MLRRHLHLAFPASVHFVTTVTEIRGNWFISDAQCGEYLRILEYYRNRFDLACLGYVLMPDHIHLLFYQGSSGAIIPTFMQRFKSYTSQSLKPQDYPISQLWRRRYDDVPLPHIEAITTRLRYMHDNPAKRGIVDNPTDYQWSSARAYLLDQNDSVVQITRPF